MSTVRLSRHAAVLALLACTRVDAYAQSLDEQCLVSADPARCRSVAAAAVTLPARAALVAAGGNPVPGTASTLGMRLPGSPRWSVALRSTAARASLPPMNNAAALTPTLWSIGADASIGVFNGVQVAPTIGGFASIDVLANIGVLGAPEAFDRASSLTWSVGTRVGILRESFTAPGVSLSASYRSIPDIEYADGGATFTNSEQNVVSVRGTVGKRVLGIGLTGGAGWDRVSADVRSGYDLAGSGITIVEDDGFRTDRAVYFGNVSYTLLIVNMSAELGWQSSADRSAGAHPDTGSGGLFGGIALRLAL